MRTPRHTAFSPRRRAAVAAAAALALVTPLALGQAPASAAGPALGTGVSDVRLGLIGLGDALAAASQQPALSEDLPLTDTSVRDVLSLDTAIGTLVDNALVDNPNTTLDTLDDAFASGPLVVKEVESSDGAPAGTREWTLKVALNADRPVALAYQDKQLEFGSAELGGKLAATLDATIRFRYDPEAIALRRFAIVGSSTLTAHVWTRNGASAGSGEQVDIPQFTVVDGFVQLDAKGTAKIDSTTVLTLRDPNGRGQITSEDFEFSSPADLFATTRAPGADDVAMDIDLSTSMEDSATGTVKVGTRAGNAKGTYAAPVVDRSPVLQDLSSLTRLQAITGFTQYTSALQAVEGAADQQFPLLDLSLTDLYSPGQQLLGLLTEQATASITCGAANTSPPTGAPRPGQVRYCQAVTSSFEPKAGTAITWESPDADVSITGPDAGAGTLDKSPTKNVVVSGGDGFPTLRVKFTDQDGVVRHARSAVSSIQDLGEAIKKLDLDGKVDYDPSRKALEIAVRQDDSSTKSTTVPTGGNGNLAPLTGLAGLCQAAANVVPRQCSKVAGTDADPAAAEGQAKVETTGRSFHADFGIGLTEPAAPLEEGQPVPTGPTFYVKPGNDGLVYKVADVAAALADNAQLVARIGFLQVDVDVTKYKLNQSGDAASASVPTTSVELPSNESVSDAVTVDDLLTDDSSAAIGSTATRGLSAEATLKVQDSPQAGERIVNADGTVTAAWRSLVADVLPTVTTDGTYDKLRLLDLVPARQGVMGEGTGGATLADASADFFTQFGVTDATPEAQREVTRPLYDLGVAGSSSTICSAFIVVDQNSLRCTKGPLADGGMDKGHPYVIDGDQDALRDVLLEDLNAVLNPFVAPAPDLGADKTFPLVDVLPTEISVARDGLGKAVGALQEKVAAEKPDPEFPVSSLQEFASTFDKLLSTSVTGGDRETARKFAFSLTQGAGSRLTLETSLETKGTRDAPMRVATAQSEVRVYSTIADGKPEVATLPVEVASQAKFVIGVDLADASSVVRADSGVDEQITKVTGDLGEVRATLAKKDADYGSARVKTGQDTSKIKFGIGVGASTGPAGSDDTWIPLADLASKVTQTRKLVGSAQTCGQPAADADKVAACLELPIDSDPAIAPVLVALKADQSSGGTGGSVTAKPIAYRFLTDALSGLNLTLSDALDGDQTVQENGDSEGAPLSLPLVGTNLDAGADVPADVDRYVAAARSALTPVEGAVKETDTAAALQTALQGALATAKDQVGSKNITATTGPVALTCTTTCTDKKVEDVQQIMVPVTLSGSQPAPVQVPFQVGPVGATILSDLTVPATTTWTLKVTVGIGRGTGPFVQLGNATADDPLLKVKLKANLASYDATSNKCHPWARQAQWQGTLPGAASRDIKNVDVPANGSTGAECIDAFVGKFPSVMVDRPVSGARSTLLDATITVDVPAPGGAGPELVYLPKLFDKDVAFTTKATGKGAISTYFESFASDAGFIDVLGTIDLDWKDGVYSANGLRFGLLKLDLTTVNNAVLPGFDKAKKWVAPLNPVVDQLTAPIPVVTNLSELVGSGPVSLMTLLQKTNTPLNLIINLLQLQNLVGGGPESGHDLRSIGEGSLAGFKVEPAKMVVAGSCKETGTAGGKAFERKNDGSGSTGRCKVGNFTKMKQFAKGEKPVEDPKGLKIDKTVSRSPYISLPSVSVPVLQDTAQIFNLILDTGDATLLYVDLGHAGVSAQITRNFGPFMVGPIPISASIGGSVGLDGRFAFGFDTRGLSKKLEALDTGDIGGFDALTAGGAKPSLFSDGFYIDDLEKGVDVPEISLTFTVQAGAGISIGIVSAGIAGGVTLDLSMDAFDPNGDGKIYSDEFAGTSTGPSCAFNVSSGMSFFLQFYFRIEFIFYTFSKSFDIVRSPRLKLFEFNCKQEDPVLAVLNGAGTSNPELLLTMGAARNLRNGYDSELSEKYTVRQLGQATTGANPTVNMQVSAFNLVQNYTVPANTVVKADGEDGADTVRLYPIPQIKSTEGQQATMPGPGDPGYVVPRFTLAAKITGGSGSDTIETGDGDDVVDGNDGDDSIRVGAGHDTVTGGAGADQIDGGEGRDTLSGGSGNDRINGGSGADEVRGDDGDDVLDGGVGSSPDALFPTTDAAAIRPLLDSGDLVVGGNGADTVTGGSGSDVVVGGGYAGAAEYTNDASVTVYGVDANNKIRRVDVTGIETLKTPTLKAAMTECVNPDTSSETGPDVVTGGDDRDFVIGGAGSDTLSGGGGDDLVCGRAGDDVLDGDGDDVETALQGDDTILGGDGADRLYGAAGDDDMYGDKGDDLVHGGDGDDMIAGGAGSDLLLGEAGVNTVYGDGAGEDDKVDPVGADQASDGRAIKCATSTSVVVGRIDLDGDLAGHDDGRLEGMQVVDGLVVDAVGENFNGVVAGVVFIDGLADLDGNAKIESRTSSRAGDTGSVPLSGITGAVGNGDCILGGNDADGKLDGGVGGDYVDAGAGDDIDVHGGSGNDLVRGGAGDDDVHGDAGNDLVAGDAGKDVLYGDKGDDVLRGGSGDDLLAGGSDTADVEDGSDEVLGDGGDDVVLGGNATLSRTALARTAIPNVGVTLLDTPSTDGTDDLLYGGVGDDWVFGQSGDDEAYGGPGEDVVEGGPGSDTVQGDDGEDLLIGGSSTAGAVTTDRTAVGVDDGNDTVVGDKGVDGLDGSDVMVGDNARLQITGDVRSSWQRIRSDVSITLFDVPNTSAPFISPSSSASGDDTMSGGGSDDLILGQSGDDTIDGGGGADGIEGGAGQDSVHGGAGNDELLGGSWESSISDAGDALYGDDGDDLLLGDNGNPANGLSPYVQLHDVPEPGATASADVSGNDTIYGGAGEDRLFGQGGDDTLEGDAGIDLLEGDAGSDRLSGGSEGDTLTGGSSSKAGLISPDRTGEGQLDGTDNLAGGSGDDVLAGDNARLDRTGRVSTDGTALRTVLLFDLATAAKNAPAGTGGADTMAGDEGRDLLFGQGGNDSLSGGADDDYLEGNDGADTLTGGTGQDDLIGGGSSKTGAIITVAGNTVTDRLLTAPARTTDESAAGLLDGNDVIDGGDARDVLLGDNGRVTRNGPTKTLAGGASGTHVVRQVAMADKVPGVWSGSDRLTGGLGDDDLYGQFDNTLTKRPFQNYLGAQVPGDILIGGGGDDALVGDQGIDVPTPAAALGAVNHTVKDKKSFLRELVRPRGSLVRVVTLTQSSVGGDDLIGGGEGADSIHAGAGKDVVNAGAGDDVVFGGDGADAIWGGADHDKLFGGAGNDLLDIKRRTRDSKLWQLVAPSEDTDRRRRTMNGRDVLYGGSGADALQADQGDAGSKRRVQGDRLIDWRSMINFYKTCQSGYGPGKITNAPSASMISTLRQLAKASGSVGSAELAIPSKKERVTKYPGQATFVCER